MDEIASSNRVILCGVAAQEPLFSHENRAERFFTFPLEVERLSGAADRLNIIVRESLLPSLRRGLAAPMEIEGELRSFNNRSGRGSRLVITVFARELSFPAAPVWKNIAALEGTLCRPPVVRITPMGREIADLLLAVNRPYGRSDYLPCIAWGRNARRAAAWTTGTRLRLLGRVQSREYMKNLDGQAVRRVAYEVSAGELEVVDV